MCYVTLTFTFWLLVALVLIWYLEFGAWDLGFLSTQTIGVHCVV